MFDESIPQPQLTTHTLTRQGPARGKQRFDVQHTRGSLPRFQDRPDRSEQRQKSSGHKSHKPRKPQGFDHDQMLQAYKGAELDIYLSDGTLVTGRLIDGDKFTLVIETTEGRQLIFKSALSSIDLPTLASIPVSKQLQGD
jgi:sRNA-binding regulator protein Hfq